MNKTSTRLVILTTILICVSVFAYNSGYITHLFGIKSKGEVNLYGMPDGYVRTANGVIRKEGDNRLDALSHSVVSDLRHQFLRLDSKKVSWLSLPESSNDSLWIRDQQRRLHSVLQGVEFDTIVLPIQQSSISYDKTARMMAARYVADDINRYTQNSVMPVEFVQKLLGDNYFQYSDKDVAALQKRYKVKQIVYLYLREDFIDREKLFLVAALHADNKIQKTHYLHFDKPTDEKSLSSILSEKTPELTENLYELQNEIEIDKSKEPGDFSFPDSLESLTVKKSPIETALHFQLLGIVLSEEQRLHERTRYFERSLLALRHVSDSVPELKILKARALFYLYRRPEAVELLSPPDTPEEKAFLSFINGNYYDLESQYRSIKLSVLHAISYIELKRLADLYQLPKVEHSLEWIGEPWRNLILHASNTRDRWKTPSNFDFFDSLTGLYPKFDIGYEGALKEKFATDQVKGEYSSGDMLFDKTITTLLKIGRIQNCCNYDDHEISEFDTLNYYRTLGLDNYLRDLEKKINLQHVNVSTNDLFEEASSLLDGDHTYMRLKVESLRNEIKTTDTSKHPKLLKSLLDNAHSIIFMTGESDKDIYWTRRILWKHLEQYKLYFEFDENVIRKVNRGKGDWPSSLKSAHTPERGSYQYEYTHHEFNSLKRVHEYLRTDESRLKALEELKTRFDGHPDKTAYLSTVLEKEGDGKGSIAILQKAVDSGASGWKIYMELAGNYLQKGKYDEAAKIYLKYPGFSTEKSEDKVRMSNRAYKAGSLVYWKGEYELAKPLYEIAANSKTGSHASLTSAQRLAYIEGDFMSAASYARQAASRYSSYYRYRDFLSLMHIFSLSEGANAVFREVAPSSSEPSIWSSLLVGHRKKSALLEDVLNELNKYSEINDHQLELIQRYIVMYSRIDRRTDSDEIEKMSEILKAPTDNKNNPKSAISRGSLSALIEPNLEEMLLADRFKGLVLTSDGQKIRGCSTTDDLACDAIKDGAIPSRFELFLRAYNDLENGRYKSSWEKFIEYDVYHPINKSTKTLGSEILPYVAMVASKLNKLPLINGYLEKNNSQTFDYWLTKAIVSSSNDQTSESVENLKKAFILIPFTESRATFTWYQLAEVSEWLFNETGDKHFIEMALSWMQDFQVIDPVHSWSYAFEAKYSKNEFRKLRATGIADYLDPNSKWLLAVPNDFKLRAREWMKKNNPFDITKQIEKGEEI